MPKFGTPIEFTSAAPNFLRDQVDTVADLYALNIGDIDEGHRIFCKANHKVYKFKPYDDSGNQRTKDSTYGYCVEIEGSLDPTDEYNLVIPEDNVNYNIYEISSLIIDNACPYMAKGCTIRFTALTDFTIVLPYTMTIVNAYFVRESSGDTITTTIYSDSAHTTEITPDTSTWYRELGVVGNHIYAYDEDEDSFVQVTPRACEAVIANNSTMSCVADKEYMLSIIGIANTCNVFSLVTLTEASATTNGFVLDN